ncbi:MAG: hypothetical protein ACI4J1_02490 [Ruminiclostridium sp.]
MELFDRKEWTISTLINDVKQKRLTRSQCIWYANLYRDKNYFDDSDMERIAEETSEILAEYTEYTDYEEITE